MGCIPETLDECMKFNPISVHQSYASKLAIFWKPRQSLRRRVNTSLSANTDSKPVKVAKTTKTASLQVTSKCSLGSCNDHKVNFKNALFHFSQHQLHGDTKEDTCAICGNTGHIPTINTSGKKWLLAEKSIFARKKSASRSKLTLLAKDFAKLTDDELRL